MGHVIFCSRGLPACTYPSTWSRVVIKTTTPLAWFQVQETLVGTATIKKPHVLHSARKQQVKCPCLQHAHHPTCTICIHRDWILLTTLRTPLRMHGDTPYVHGRGSGSGYVRKETQLKTMFTCARVRVRVRVNFTDRMAHGAIHLHGPGPGSGHAHIWTPHVND